MKYKVKDCYMLREIAGDKIVMPRGESAMDFNGVLVLNDACAVLWEKLAAFVSETELSEALVTAFGISADIAAADTKACINKMLEFGLLDTEND